MPISKDFTKVVLREVEQGLADVGFERRRPRIVVRNCGADVLGTVGLNVAIQRGGGILEVNPVVGVRHQQIERLVATLTGDAFDEVVPPTLAGNVGYLSPQNRYVAFLFSETAEIEQVASQLCDAVATHGIAFIEKMTGVAELVHAMQTVRFGIPFVTDYRIPVGLALLGQHEEAQRFLARKIVELGTRSDPEAVRFRGFADMTAAHFRLSVP
jgi:hypothetical protein